MNDIYVRNTENLNWNVGGFMSHDRYLIDLLDKCKEMQISLPFKYVFGSIPCKWQGGRIAPRDATLGVVARLIHEYNSRGVGVRFTFSSYLINEADLSDEVCNAIMQLLSNDPRNGVIISSDILYDYIKQKYPQVQMIASIVKSAHECPTADAAYYNRLINKYDLVVIDSSFIDEPKFLSKLSDCSKIEFLANHRCMKNCPMAAKHYDTQTKLEQAVLADNKADIEKYSEQLKKINEYCIHAKTEDPTNISTLSQSDIYYLIGLGCTNFKLEGRDYDGLTFVRDLGTWIFDPYGPYLGIAHVILGNPV